MVFAARLEAQYAHQRGIDMIPLMVERDYSANGWLGLLLGTRLYYVFDDAPDLDEAVFEVRHRAIRTTLSSRVLFPFFHSNSLPKLSQGRIDKVVRELGHRGMPTKAAVAAEEEEALPKAAGPMATARKHSPALAPAPAQAAAAPAATATTLNSSLTPMQHNAATVDAVQQSDFLEKLSNFLEKQQAVLTEREAQAEAKAEKSWSGQAARWEVTLARQRDELAALALKELAAPARPFSEAQFAGFQQRCEGLHAAKLLTDEEFFALEVGPKTAWSERLRTLLTSTDLSMLRRRCCIMLYQHSRPLQGGGPLPAPDLSAMCLRLPAISFVCY